MFIISIWGHKNLSIFDSNCRVVFDVYLSSFCRYDPVIWATIRTEYIIKEVNVPDFFTLIYWAKMIYSVTVEGRKGHY